MRIAHRQRDLAGKTMYLWLSPSLAGSFGGRSRFVDAPPRVVETTEREIGLRQAALRERSIGGRARRANGSETGSEVFDSHRGVTSQRLHPSQQHLAIGFPVECALVLRD